MTNLCFYLIILLIKKINTPYIANTYRTGSCYHHCKFEYVMFFLEQRVLFLAIFDKDRFTKPTEIYESK